MGIIIGSDHTGFLQGIVDFMKSLDHEVDDVRFHDPNRVDFPGIGSRVENTERGLLVCETGVDASIAANNLNGIRAVVYDDVHSANEFVDGNQISSS